MNCVANEGDALKIAPMKPMSSLVCSFLAAVAFVPVLSAAESPIFPALKDALVVSEGQQLKKFDDASLAQTKYFAFYYSASWCGPCRAFTPDLVKWYKLHKKDNPQFELIFVSDDRSEKDMAAYMKTDAMPWPALEFAKKSASKALTHYCGPGIPCLVLVDDTGKVLSDSFQGQTYLGPRKVLADIEKTLRAHPASAEARTAAGLSKPTQPGSSDFDSFFKNKPADQ
jgi:nucleoredoxin